MKFSAWRNGMADHLEPARLCQHDNWDTVLDDPTPRAVRWAARVLQRCFHDPDRGRWHYTEGNGAFTACGAAVVPFMVDGSPQEDDSLARVDCRRCLAKMRPFTQILSAPKASASAAARSTTSHGKAAT